MKKSKIAISLDSSLLNTVDSKVDGSVIRSRSQAIEFFLKKGLQEQSINTAVLLIKGEHQLLSLKKIKGESLLKRQIDLFQKNGITKLYIVTHHSENIHLLLNEIGDANIEVKVIEKEVSGNAKALFSIKDLLKQSFAVMSGDTYNDFEMANMIKKHINSDKLATIGLMSRAKPSKYGAAVLDGDLVIDFQEKPKISETHIVNAGVYIFKPEVFELFSRDTVSIEKDLLPRIARIKQLVGYFTHGEYMHIGE